MGGPLSFLFGLGLIGADAMQISAKKEEIRRYSEQKKALNHMPDLEKMSLEAKFDREFKFLKYPGGIDMKKLEALFQEKYGRPMNISEGRFAVMNYFFKKFTPYNYHMWPNGWGSVKGTMLDFNFDEVKVDNWGTRVEYDPNVEELFVWSYTKPINERFYKKDFQGSIYKQAQWIEYYVWNRYSTEGRDQWVLPYEIFDAPLPDWLEGRNRCYMRILEEQGLKEELAEECRQLYGFYYDSLLYYKGDYFTLCLKDKLGNWRIENE